MLSGENNLAQLLRYRAGLLAKIRQFFALRGLIEVDVPLLGASAVTDPHLDSLQLDVGGKAYYLQTSPEFFIKRLLAEGCDSLYYLGKAFRSDELGQRHNPEFTMLEWYRIGFSDTELMQELAELLRFLQPGVQVQQYSYSQLFETFVGVEPHSASVDELKEAAQSRLKLNWPDEGKSFWLDLLFSHLVEPQLQDLTIVYDYPAAQAALAKKGRDIMGEEVAKRFEVFWRGIELANAYWELTDAGELRQRFSADNERRLALGKKPVAMDEAFLQAHESGLPECAGIALGVDRLMMCLRGEQDIAQVMPFTFSEL